MPEPPEQYPERPEPPEQRKKPQRRQKPVRGVIRDELDSPVEGLPSEHLVQYPSTGVSASIPGSGEDGETRKRLREQEQERGLPRDPRHVGGLLIGEHRLRDRQGNLEPAPEEVAKFLVRNSWKSHTRLFDDVLWVSENLDNPGLLVRDCPNLRCWSLLHWARENRNEFFRSMLPGAEKDAVKEEAVREAREAGEAEWEQDRLERRTVSELRGMLEEWAHEAARIQVTPGGQIELPVSARV